MPSGETVFAGQRAQGFHVDLGPILDLNDLCPLSLAQLISGPASAGVNATARLNVDCIAMQLPITRLTGNSLTPSGSSEAAAVIGVWITASPQKARLYNQGGGQELDSGPFV